jgi:hypothetical protein
LVYQQRSDRPKQHSVINNEHDLRNNSIKAVRLALDNTYHQHQYHIHGIHLTNNKKGDELAMVPLPNSIRNPRTMVVLAVHAIITFRAVMRSDWAKDVASIAPSQLEISSVDLHRRTHRFLGRDVVEGFWTGWGLFRKKSGVSHRGDRKECDCRNRECRRNDSSDYYKFYGVEHDSK